MNGQITADALKASPPDFRLVVEVVADRAADLRIGSVRTVRLALRSLSAERVLQLYRAEGPAFRTELASELRRVKGEPEIGPLFRQVKAGTRRCKICGCTDDDCHQCIEKTGEACHWVAPDLCSACSPEEPR